MSTPDFVLKSKDLESPFFFISKWDGKEILSVEPRMDLRPHIGKVLPIESGLFIYSLSNAWGPETYYCE